MVFEDRADAGRKLLDKLKRFAGRDDVLLFALPRGGVVVGKEIAEALKLPLDLIVTRKIGSPWNEEYAVGALAETGETVWNEEEHQAIGKSSLDKIISREVGEAARRVKTYRRGRALADMEGKTAVVIDDGVATGLTMRAAIAALKHQRAARIIVAVPHGAKESLTALRKEADEVIALDEPLFYGAVGQFYRVFPQIEDAEVLEVMKRYGPK